MNKKYLIAGVIIFAIIVIFLLVLNKPSGNNNKQINQSAANKINNNQQAAQPAISGFQNASGQNELNVAKRVGNFLVTVTDARVIPNSQARPYLNPSINKDVLMLDLLFVGGDNCQKDCEIPSLGEYYRLVDQNGFLKSTEGIYTTLWESAPFLGGNALGGPRHLKAGEKSSIPVYFLLDPTDNGNYTFYYQDFGSQNAQFFNLKVGLN